MLLEMLANSALTYCRLDRVRVTLIGVSGGPDSLCLLDGLDRLGFRIVAAHFDHHLRPESGVDSRRVEKMAADRGIPFVFGAGDVPALAREEHLSIEEAARKSRYSFLFQQARLLDAQAVAVGHTADDQCETVLMHFLRGSGLAGLRGMEARLVLPEWDAEIPLVRPLLGAWRADTQAYCREWGLEPVIDSSNEEMTFFRNRLRGEVIPYLEQYNPRFKESLIRMSEVLAGDEEILEGAVSDAWEETASVHGEGYTGLDLSVLAAMQVGIQRRVIRQAILKLVPGLRDIDFDTVSRCLDFATQAPSGSALKLIDNICLLSETGILYIYLNGSSLPATSWIQLASGAPVSLGVPGKLMLLNNQALSAEFLDLPDSEMEAKAAPATEVWLDAGCINVPLTVRAFRAGDRFQPLGMVDGSMKVSDFFINEKIPLRARPYWPLVFSGERLVWITGLRMSEFARVSASSQKVLRLRLEQMSE